MEKLTIKRKNLKLLKRPSTKKKFKISKSQKETILNQVIIKLNKTCQIYFLNKENYKN